MTNKVYLVYSVETTPHGFSSDWQDHRKFKIDKAFVDKAAADYYKKSLLDSGRFSAYIEEHDIYVLTEGE